MEALFACTKCHSRHPFEELSGSEQLCKDCRSNYPIVKCTFCRSEFQQEDKANTNSICKKCAYNVKVYGKPTACEYCSIIAAFIGNKCQRCTNSEKKYGPPLTCEQCQQQCAFQRNEDSRKKVQGKTLCWMCTITYKRLLAKNRHKSSRRETLQNSSGREGGGSLQGTPLSSSGNTPTTKGTPTVTPTSRPSSAGLPTSKSRSKDYQDRHKTSAGTKEKKEEKDKDREKRSTTPKEKSVVKEDKDSTGDKESSTGTKHKSEGEAKGTRENGEGSAAKKPKLEKSASNGLAKSSPSTSFTDFNNSEHIVMITQLREEVESLKKQVAVKEQTILDRDKKITELKAQNFEAEKEMRGKVQSLQKSHIQATDSLQAKIRDLQRQVASLSKTSRKMERVSSQTQLQQLAKQDSQTEAQSSPASVATSEFT